MEPSGNLSLTKQEPTNSVVDEVKTIGEYWNSNLAGKMRGVRFPFGEKRTSSVKKIIDTFGKEDIYKMIDEAKIANERLGEGGIKWIADFDWCITPDNFRKISEGGYRDYIVDNKIVKNGSGEIDTTIHLRTKENRQDKDFVTLASRRSGGGK